MTNVLKRRYTVLSLLLILALLVAACGGNGNGDTDADSGGEDENAGNNAETQQEDTDSSADRDDTITFTISGDAVADGTVNTQRWATTASSDIRIGMEDAFVLVLFAEPLRQQLTINGIPYDVQPGEYAMVGTQDANPEDITVSYVHDANNTYSNEGSGTLTIESVGDMLAGSFAFDAVKDTDASVTISVNGSFRDVPVPVQEAEDGE